MKNPAHLKSYILLISLLLLIGQLGTLVHAVEHPYHEADHGCEAYLVLEQSKHALVFDSISVSLAFEPIQSQTPFATYTFSEQALYLARAPPACP